MKKERFISVHNIKLKIALVKKAYLDAQKRIDLNSLELLLILKALDAAQKEILGKDLV